MHLLKNLTAISNEDYVGKELCPTCLKNVAKNHQAISCSSCDRWTHRKCTGSINKTKYKKLSQLSTFTWFCNNCRDSETPLPKLDEPLKLNPKNLPIHFSIVKKGKNELLIIHINCRSMINKEEEIFDIINLLNPDIICLSETWLDGSVPIKYVPKGYKILRKDRSEEFLQKYRKIKGGGLAIIYRSYLNIIPKPKITPIDEEIFWVQVQTKNNFLLGVIYRPEYSLLLQENEDGESALEKNIRKASEISNRIVILGDFNIDLLNKSHKNTKYLYSILNSYNLTQHIKNVTRIDMNTGKGTLIDHVWTSSEMKVIKSGTCQGISDHLGIFIKLDRTNINAKIKPPEKISRNYKNYDPQKFSEDTAKAIANSKIEKLIEEKNLDAATEELISVISETASIHAPLNLKKYQNSSTYIPWMTDELSLKIAQKNELLYDYFVSRDPILKARFDDLKNKITTEKRNIKQKWIEEEIKKAGNDPFKLWKLYNYLTGREKTYECIEPENITQEKANQFNEFFCNIGKSKNHNPDESQNFSSPVDSSQANFNFNPENTTKIEKLIEKLKDKTATGYDYLDVRLIKDLKKVIAPILTKLINLGNEVKKFPNCLKRAIIKPIHKSEDPNNISNYRPIALLPILSKIFERAATDQIMEFLIKNLLLTRTQHAYLKNHSTITFLVEAINFIYKLLDQKLHTALVKIDLSKAFDTINHKKLINKLKTLGLNENALSWIESYLGNRTQKTKFQYFTSSENPVTTGVPQGSILGPLLFICFTNDLASNFDDSLCKLLSYADDSTFIVNATSSTELKSKIKTTLEKAQSWFIENEMKINTDKTQILVFKNGKHQNKITIPITYQNKKIKLVSEPYVEILGILIDENLSWEKQINHVRKKSMNATRNVHRVNKMLPKKSRLNMYHCIISPNFDYGDVLFGGCSIKNSKRLQRVQNFAVKSITGNRKYDSATKSFQELKLLNLQQRRKVHESVFIHKAISKNSSRNLQEEYSNYQPKAQTRRYTSGKLIIPTHNTSKFKKSPLYRTIATWNSIPNNIPKDSINSHKTKYQNYLIAQTFN